jgi:lysophospholipase L1-like esterase
MTSTISFYGDSTTYGTEFDAATGLYLPTQTPNNEPAVVGAALGTTVVNHGCPGATATNLFWGTGTATSEGDWFTALVNDPSPTLLLNVGLNDLLRDAPGEYEANLAAMIDLAHGFGKTIYVETPNPTTFADMAPIAQEARDVATVHGAGVIDQFAAIQAFVPDWQTHLPDGIHPDDSLYRFKAVIDIMTLLGAFH